MAQLIDVGGGGSGGGTPPGFLNVQAYGAIADDPGDGTGTDNGPAFSACFAAAVAQGKGVWIPGGPAGASLSYRIASQAVAHGLAIYQRTLDVVGGGGAASVLIDCPGIEALLFTNFLTVTVEGIAFRGPASLTTGLPKQTIDAQTIISFASCTTGNVQDCTFKWVASDLGNIWSSIGGLFVRRVDFMGASSNNAFIYATNWKAVVIEDTYANDIGYINGSTSGSKANALVVISKHFIWLADATEDLGAWSEQGAVIQRVWADEFCGGNAFGDATPGAGAQIYVRSTTGRASFVRIEDTQVSAGHLPGVTTGPVYYLEHVRDVWVKRSTGTLLFGGLLQRDALSVSDILNVEADAFRCQTVATTANTIRASSSVTNLTLKNMVQGVDYYALVSSATTTNVPPSNLTAPVLSSDHAYPDHGSTLSCTAGTWACANGTPTITYMLEIASGDTIQQAFGTDTPQRWALQGSTGAAIATPDATIGYGLRMRVRATDPLTGLFADVVTNVLRVPALEVYLGAQAKIVQDERGMSATGTALDSWANQGSGATPFIASGVSRPILDSFINGWSAPRFDGGVSQMTNALTVTAVTAAGTRYTTYVVLNPTSVPAAASAISGAGIFGDDQAYWNAPVLANVAAGGNKAYTSNFPGAPPGQAIATGAPVLVECSWDGVNVSVRVAAAAAVTAAAANIQAPGLVRTLILGYIGAGTAHYQGLIGSLVETNTALTGNTDATVRAYLGNKYAAAY